MEVIGLDNTVQRMLRRGTIAEVESMDILTRLEADNHLSRALLLYPAMEADGISHQYDRDEEICLGL